MRRLAIVGFLLVLVIVVVGNFVVGKRIAQQKVPTQLSEPTSYVSTSSSLSQNILAVRANKEGPLYPDEFRIMTVQPSIKRQIGEWLKAQGYPGMD